MTPTVTTDYAVLNHKGEAVTTTSHRDIAEQYAARSPDFRVAVRVVTVAYEPVPAEIKLRRVS